MIVKFHKYFAATAFAITTMASGAAVATPFVITNTQITPSTGYGIDASENSTRTNTPTLLNTVFTVTTPATIFTLTNANEFFDFTFGTVFFNEPNNQDGITADEMDNLGVTTTFTFSQPGVGAQTVTATGTAVLGAVNDPNNGTNQTDLTIDWAALSPISFGTGGSFKIELNDLIFTANGTQNATARITLLSPGQTAGQPGSVPEPGSLALAALGLAAAGVVRRRKR